MQCECCQAEIPEGIFKCPECKMPITQTIAGFYYTKPIQREMRALIEEQSENIANTEQLIGMTADYLVNWDMERRLINKMLKLGALDAMIAAADKDQAVNDARELMMTKGGASEAEAEFVLAVLTYMVKQAYMSPLAMKEEKKKVEEEPEDKPVVIDMDSRPFKRSNAMIHRISKRIFVKEGFTKIDAYCFDGFGIVRNITLPSTLMCIEEYAFTDCKHLAVVEIPPSVKKIEKGAFNLCVSLWKVNIPEGVLELGDNTFLCCSSLEKLVIPPTVSGFGENCFSGCDNLEMLVVPQSVKYIGENCFAYCPKLVIYCYENSYVHRYCLQNNIKFKTTALGQPLPTGDRSRANADN